MTSSTRTTLEVLLDDNKEARVPPSPRLVLAPSPQNPSPRPSSVNHLANEMQEINDPKRLLERNSKSIATLSWHARQSARGKGGLDELRKYKEKQEQKAAATARFFVERQEQAQEKLKAILAKKNQLPLFSQATTTSQTQLIAPKPVKATGAIKIQL